MLSRSTLLCLLLFRVNSNDHSQVQIGYKFPMILAFMAKEAVDCMVLIDARIPQDWIILIRSEARTTTESSRLVSDLGPPGDR